MDEKLFKRLESFRKQRGLSILALCRQMGTCNVTYHRWKKAKKITGLYKKIVKEFIDKNENIVSAEINKNSQVSISQSRFKPTSDIAVIGVACFYPGSSNVKELWENIVGRRIQFRRLLDERLPLKDYYDQDPKAADKIYLTKAAFIDGFEFNWSNLRIPKKTFESTDIVHWLALDIALKAFENAGYKLDKVPLQNTGIILGNTLTGEQTRSQTLRLRWPYVQKTLSATLESFGVSGEDTKRFSEALEKVYKSAFYPITEDSLAGGLANTIAGRICNYLNLKGGGYIVDGACSSSLLAISTAANALSLNEIDLALAGGVDVSLDPFELVGFSKAGALAKDQMRVYDKRADGFLPGEGCGFVVLKRLDDAVRDRNYIYAVIKGWGISSDGKGGIMEPSVSGQALAIERAYKHLDYKISDVDFIEGHGTGTTKGDRVELEGIATAINKQTRKNTKIYGVTSFKSIVGHTKAAAGIGGFIKAVLAVNQRILPPTANCTQPNEIFKKETKELYPIMQGRIYSKDKIMRAGISSAGFGGINCHVAIESKDNPNEKIKPDIDELALFVNNQETEIFVFASRTILHLRKLIQKFKEDLRNISIAEMADLSARLNKKVKTQAPIKIAIVTDTPEHLYEALLIVEKELESNLLKEGEILEIKSKDPVTYILLSNRVKNNRIGFLYSGQGAQRINMARTLVERFTWAKDLLNITKLPLGEYIYKPENQLLTKENREEFQKKLSETQITQPAICFSSLVWTEFLSKLGIEPIAVSGHSLGEVTAFYKAGAFDKKTLLQLAELRGKLMAEKSESAGMLSLSCDSSQTRKLISEINGNLVVSNLNSPNQTVVSGSMKDIQNIIKLTSAENISTHLLPVSNAFHSSFMQSAALKIVSEPALKLIFKTGSINIYSGIDGSPIKGEIKLNEYFSKQILSQVNFIQLVESMSKECDLFIEVGPGRILSDLVKAINKNNKPQCFPLETIPQNDRDLNVVLAQIFIRNTKINWEELYRNRIIKPFVPASRKKFIKNQCERSLKVLAHKEKILSFKFPEAMQISGLQEKSLLPTEAAQTIVSGNADSIANILLELTHKLTGFERESLSLNLRLLDDLNMDSIKAAELIAEAGKILGLSGQIDPSQYSNNTLLQIRDQLVELKKQVSGIITPSTNKDDVIDRYRQKTWTRDFVVEFIEEKIGQKDLNLLKRLNKINILCDESQTRQASSLKDNLKNKAVEIVVMSDELTKMPKEDFGNSDCLIYILSANQGNGSFEEKQLKQIINRFHRVMDIATEDGIHKAKTIVFVQFGGGNFGENEKLKNIASSCSKSFASTLHIERPDLCIKIIDFDQHLPSEIISRKIIEELQTRELFSIAGFDKNLKRKVPIFQNTQPAFYKKRNIDWTPQDIVLVTGGAKGITAECALEFAKKTRTQMILVGRSKLPTETKDQNNEIIRTLNRFKKEGLKCLYYSCDVTNLKEVTQVIDKIEKNYGKITAVIHGAGLNTLKRLKQTNSEDAYYEALPKVMGAVNICKVLEKNPLKLIVGITSIIGITGMEGSAWYGLSNEILNLFLHQFKAKHKETEVVTIAYSVWDEVGMGMRLQSLDWLLNKGISPIPIEEGTKRFMRLVEASSGSQQTIITARIGGIDTWRSLPASERNDLRFIEDIKYYMPGVELIAQAHLNIKDDSYVLDHNWKGTLLFPFVFGLEAMAQALSYVTDSDRFNFLKAKDIHLDRPISVNQELGTIIEIHVEIQESKNKHNEAKIKVEIYSEQDNFNRVAFSATIEIMAKKGAIANKRKYATTLEHLEKKIIDINLEQNVYGKILFQGKDFQCINRLYRLFYDDKEKKGECLFVANYNKTTPNFLAQSKKFSTQFLVGDPFFIDSILQSMQLIIPRDISLPNYIEEIKIVPVRNYTNILPQLISSRIKKISTDIYEGSANAIANTISIKNCHLKVLEHFFDNPSANDLANPAKYDQEIIDKKLNEFVRQFHIELPVIKCFYVANLKNSSKINRHKIEVPCIKKTIAEFAKKDQKQIKNINIKWTGSGKPIIDGKEFTDLNISLSHKDNLLLCIAGEGDQGCDIEIIPQKTEKNWLALLGKNKHVLLKKLVIDFDINMAGTFIWCASETKRKIKDNDETELIILKSNKDYVVFGWPAFSKDSAIIVFSIILTRGEIVVSIFVRQSSKKILEEDREVQNVLGYDKKVFQLTVDNSGPQGQSVYSKRFPITFQYIQTQNKNVSFTKFFDWMGQIREYSLFPIAKDLKEILGSGLWGMVTNHAKIRFLSRLKADDILEIRLWLDKISGDKDSVLDLKFDWLRLLANEKYERVASSEQRISWIKIIGHGQGKITNLPLSLREFMNSMKPKSNFSRPLESYPEPLKNLSAGKKLGEFFNKHIQLTEQTFMTTLEESNLVGNIYFSNYAKWLGKTIDLYFFYIFPEYYVGSGKKEFFCTSCEIQHLNEAMPFEKIKVIMFLNKIYERGLDLYFEFFKEAGNAPWKRLAFANHSIVWGENIKDIFTPTDLPSELLNNLKIKQSVTNTGSIK